MGAAAVELRPPAASSWVAEIVAGVLRGEVGVKLQALLTTAAVPATVPSIETVTVSPLTPVPAMARLGRRRCRCCHGRAGDGRGRRASAGRR